MSKCSKELSIREKVVKILIRMRKGEGMSKEDIRVKIEPFYCLSKGDKVMQMLKEE